MDPRDRAAALRQGKRPPTALAGSCGRMVCALRLMAPSGQVSHQVLAGSVDGGLLLLDARLPGRPLLRFRHGRKEGGSVYAARPAVDPTGRLVAVGCPDGLVRIWSARTGTLLRTMDVKDPLQRQADEASFVPAQASYADPNDRGFSIALGESYVHRDGYQKHDVIAELCAPAEFCPWRPESLLVGARCGLLQLDPGPDRREP